MGAVGTTALDLCMHKPSTQSTLVQDDHLMPQN